MEFTFQRKRKDSNQQTSGYVHTMCEITRGVSGILDFSGPGCGEEKESPTRGAGEQTPLEWYL